MEKSHVAAQGPFLSPSEPRADIANGATLESLAATTKGSMACAPVAECRADPEAQVRVWVRPHSTLTAGAACLGCSPAGSHQLCTTGLVSIWPTFSTLESGSQGSNLDFSNLENPTSLATTHVPASVSPPAPRGMLPTPVSQFLFRRCVHPKGEGGHLPNLLGVFSQEPLVWREERGSVTSSPRSRAGAGGRHQV